MCIRDRYKEGNWNFKTFLDAAKKMTIYRADGKTVQTYGVGTWNLSLIHILYGGSYQGKNTVSVEPSKSSLFSPLMFKVDSTVTEPFSESNSIWMKFFTDDSVDEGAVSLKGAAGLLWYVKTPASKLRAQFPIWNPQEDWSIGPPANKDIYVCLLYTSSSRF